MRIILSSNSKNTEVIDKTADITGKNVMYACKLFAGEHYEMPEEIFIIASGKFIEINLESMLQSELDKQLQEKTI